MDQNDSQFNEHVQSSKRIWSIIFTVAITTLITGGGVYAWQRSNSKSTEENFQQQIVKMQNQLEQLQQAKANQDQQESKNNLVIGENQNDNQNVNQANSLAPEQIKETTKYPNNAKKLVGYYTKYLDKAWGEEKYCTSITITGGDRELINSFIELINAGSSVHDKNERNQPIVNLDISILSELERQKFLNSTRDEQVELVVLTKNKAFGAPICYSTLEILGINISKPVQVDALNQPVVNINSYAYGNKVLSYTKNPQLQYSDQYVTVYISDGSAKTEIIHQVPIDIAGGGMPEFKKTSKPNMALLTTSFGDLGAFFSRYYYINLDTKKVVQINNTNGPTLEITDVNNQFSKIQLSITDNCGTGENRREDMNAILKDLTVNSKAQNVIAQTRSLKCVNPGGIGDIYSPSPTITISGVSSDISKIFFSLEGNSWNNNQKTVLWKNNYSFDLGNKTIKGESPANIL